MSPVFVWDSNEDCRILFHPWVKLYETNKLTTMIKSALAAVATVAFSSTAALAGPYVNIENNAGFTGSDFEGSVTETHVGYESALGENSAWYIQGGPAFVSPDGGDVNTELSGKVGIGADVTDKVNVYAEIAAQTTDEINFDEDLNFGTKLGIKYSF